MGSMFPSGAFGESHLMAVQFNLKVCFNVRFVKVVIAGIVPV